MSARLNTQKVSMPNWKKQKLAVKEKTAAIS